MTAEEQQMIQSLADRINGAPLAEKDPDAEQFLQQALGRNPDALYILAQTTLVQQYALEQAQKQLADTRAQIEQQRQQAQQPKHATSFLGNLLGRHDEPPPPPPPRPSYPAQYSQGGSSFSGPQSGAPGSGYVPVPPPPPYGQPQYVPVSYGQPQFGGLPYGPPQSGGFLRSALQTATGVAAGALAFEGVESLLHGFGGSSAGSSFGGGRPEEIINNNYYGDSGPAEHREHLSSDIEDRRGDHGFDDAVNSGDHNFGGDGSSGKDDLLDGNGTDGNGTDGSGLDGGLGDDGGSFGADDSSLDDSGSDGSSFDDGGGSGFDDGN